MTAALGALLVALAGGTVFYAYVGYPLILMLVPRRWQPPASHGERPAESWPRVSFTLAAYNEETALPDTLESLLQVDYPPDRRQIIVISDASTDRTDDIARAFADRGVELLRLRERSGKTTAENESRAVIRGDIVVNTDASVRIPPHALKPLIAVFQDSSVGVASGRDVSTGTSMSSTGESGYVGYEMWVRDLETRAGGIVGASGCFYAARRDLHGEIVPAALSRDFAAPLIAREHGFRSVSVPEALCFVPRTASLRREYTRKVRTMARGLETLFYKRHLMNPLRHGWFAWMLLSHKLARWLAPWAAALALLGLGLLGVEFPLLWGVIAAVMAAGGIVAAVAWNWPAHRPMPRVLAVPAYLVFGVLAAGAAWSRALRQELNPVWEPTRR